MNEEKAVAIMMANLKGAKIHKPVSLIEFADACRFLITKWGIKEMSRHFRTSEYMLRQIDKINELSPKLKKLVNDRKFGIDTAYQLWRISEPKRSQVAKEIKNMPTSDVRRFVYFIFHNPKLSIDKCKKLFEKEKPEQIQLLIIPLDSKTYENLKTIASRSKLKIHDYALKILKAKIHGT